MPLLVELTKWEIGIFVLALGASIGIKLLTGEINTKGLLFGRITGRPTGQDEYFSPERLQLLIATLGAAFYYLTLVLTNPNPGTFPEVPQTWPAILGGSNALYLGGKAYARWLAAGNSKKEGDKK